MELFHTFVKGIYYNPTMPKGDNKNRLHCVWNKYKRKMIPLTGVDYIDNTNTYKYNNEYLQALIQGYDFTIIDHIYEKNNKNYKYNNITLKFDEIKFNIKCLRKGDDINYPELSDKEVFEKVFKEMGLRDTFVKDIYCQKYDPEKMIREQMPRTCYTNQVHFVWNNYKRKMIPLEGIYFITDNNAKIYNNEYLQSAIQGYKFTFMEHIYEKDKKYYKYSFGGNGFYEIKLDSI